MNRLKWSKISAIVNSRSGQERLLITVTLLLTVYVSAFFIIQPRLQAMKTTVSHEIMAYKTLIENQNRNIQQMITAYKKGANPGTPKRINDLQQQLSQFNKKLNDTNHLFVDAHEMITLIKPLLSEHKLQLQHLENMPPETVTSDPEQTTHIYKHGIYLELAGSYHNHIRFLERLKRLPWNIFWQELHLQANQPGQITVSLSMYTLNDSPVWLKI